jgi:hypothetical protein
MKVMTKTAMTTVISRDWMVPTQPESVSLLLATQETAGSAIVDAVSVAGTGSIPVTGDAAAEVSGAN